jgi:predicted acetyltransferase
MPRLIRAAPLEVVPSFLDALTEGFSFGNRVDHLPDAAAIERYRSNPEGFASDYLRGTDTLTLEDDTEMPRPEFSEFWWVDGTEFIGGIQIRHELSTAILAAYGGHLSAGIRPGRRGGRNGIHARMMLEAAVDEARLMGIPRLLSVSRASNVHAWKHVEAAGGIFMDEIPASYATPPYKLRRYVIPTGNFDPSRTRGHDSHRQDA